VAKEARDVVNSYGIKWLNSSNGQANGQAESSNKTLVKLINIRKR
jgi:hypothetical protein